MQRKYIDFSNYKCMKEGQLVELPIELIDLLNGYTQYVIKANMEHTKKSLFSQLIIISNYSLLKIKNIWYVMDPKARASGSFGEVFCSPFKIINNQLTVEANVIKCISLPKSHLKETLDSIKNEVTLLKKHRIAVRGMLQTPDNYYVVMEDCGTSLDKVFPNKFTFLERLEVACNLCNEMQLLKNEETIHCDLKPQNTCYKKVGNSIRITFVDFGLAEKQPDEHGAVNPILEKGTPFYMAPEILFDGSNFATDLYVLAGLLALIFGARDITRNKLNKFNRDGLGLEMYETPFCLDGIFEGYHLPVNIDRDILNEIIELINSLQSLDPIKRPNVELVSKFFLLIIQRLAANQDFINQWSQIEDEVKTLKLLLKNCVLDVDSQNLNLILQKLFTKSISYKEMQEFFNEKKIPLFTGINFPPYNSHLVISTLLLTQNRSSNDYHDCKPYPNFSLLLVYMQGINSRLNDLLSTFNRVGSLIESDNLRSTNDESVQRLKSLFQERISIFARLNKIQCYATATNMPSLCKTLFGRTQNPDVQKLFHDLSDLQVESSSNEDTIMQLKKIERSIVNN